MHQGFRADRAGPAQAGAVFVVALPTAARYLRLTEGDAPLILPRTILRSLQETHTDVANGVDP